MKIVTTELRRLDVRRFGDVGVKDEHGMDNKESRCEK